MCWIFHEIRPIWLPIHCPLKKIVYALMKSPKNMPESRNDVWFCPTPFAVLKIFDHWGDVLICLLINTNAPSHWLKSVTCPVGPALKFRDISDWLHNRSNDVYSVMLSWAWLSTACVSLDALPAQMMTFIFNRQTKWISRELPIAANHFQEAWNYCMNH